MIISTSKRTVSMTRSWFAVCTCARSVLPNHFTTAHVHDITSPAPTSQCLCHPQWQSHCQSRRPLRLRRTQTWAQSPVGNGQGQRRKSGLGVIQSNRSALRQKVFIAPTAFHVVAAEAACLRGAQAIPRHVALVQDTLRDGVVEENSGSRCKAHFGPHV
jgi:hypothetical protein